MGMARNKSGHDGGEMSAASAPASGPNAGYLPVRQEWLDRRRESILEPELPIIDPHHHLWDRP
jgi:hypothetical protein